MNLWFCTFNFTFSVEVTICVYYSLLYWKTESFLIFESMLACSLFPGLHPILLYQFFCIFVFLFCFCINYFSTLYICVYIVHIGKYIQYYWIFNKRRNRFKLGELSLVKIHLLKTNAADRRHKAAHRRIKLTSTDFLIFLIFIYLFIFLTETPWNFTPKNARYKHPNSKLLIQRYTETEEIIMTIYIYIYTFFFLMDRYNNLKVTKKFSIENKHM